MTYLHGRNTLESLDIPLSEIYSLRRSGSNELPLAEVDMYLRTRPDYVLYRLLRDRPPHSPFFLPEGTGGGADLLFSTLTDVANSSDPTVKWTGFGLLSQFALYIAQDESALRWVRMPQRLSDTEIPIGDRLQEDDLRRILKWLKLRAKKFAGAKMPVKQPLRSNRRQVLPMEDLVEAEHALLLALGQISIFHISKILGEITEETERAAIDLAFSSLSVANGGWRPGQPVFVQNLWHHRKGYRDNKFGSCFLPIDLYEYGAWVAAATAEFGKDLQWASAGLKLLLGLTSIQIREWLFSKKSGRESFEEGRTLMVSIDRTMQNALSAHREILAGGLASRYLSIGNILGWSTEEYGVVRLKRAKTMKAIAKSAGCIVDGAAASMDFSIVSAQHSIRETNLHNNADHFRSLLRQAESNSGGRFQSSSAVTTNTKCDEADIRLDRIATALNWDLDRNIQSNGIALPRLAAERLARHERSDATQVERLLELDNDLFGIFVDVGLVAGLASLVELLHSRGRLRQSSILSENNISKFADMLLEWLERPYMADIEARAKWQRSLWIAYSTFSEMHPRALTLDAKLSVFAAVSHVTAAALKGLKWDHADQLEETIYEERAASTAPLSSAKAKSALRVDADHLLRMLQQQESRGRCRTAFIQMLMSQDAATVTVLIVRHTRGSLAHKELVIDFDQSTHAGIAYNSWNDVIAETSLHDFFNNVTGGLNDYNDSPLGQKAVQDLWSRILSGIAQIASGVPEHLLISPDGALAGIPWQLVAMAGPPKAGPFPLINLVHGLRWLYITAHEPEELVGSRFYHDRGIQAWISPDPTPSVGLDIRMEVKEFLFGADNGKPALTDQAGLSMSAIFGHGEIDSDRALAETAGIQNVDQWRDVRNSRICVLLSCYTGAGKPGALGDYLSISHRLSRVCKALIAPPIEVPHTAVLTLAAALGRAVSAGLSGDTHLVQDIYRASIITTPAIALFSLWGVGYEPIIWFSHPPKAMP